MDGANIERISKALADETRLLIFEAIADNKEINAIQHKDLPTVRVGRCRLITEKALREWLERKTEASVETHDSTG